MQRYPSFSTYPNFFTIFFEKNAGPRLLLRCRVLLDVLFISQAADQDVPVLRRNDVSVKALNDHRFGIGSVYNGVFHIEKTDIRF